MFILKRKKKKKNIPSLFSSLSLLIVRLLEFLSVWNTFPLFFPVSLNSATFGISQCLEYFTRLKKEGFLRAISLKSGPFEFKTWGIC